jgi:hypothetical protein
MNRTTTAICAAFAMLGSIAPAGVPSAGATASGDPENPDPSHTHCLASFVVNLDPGFSMTPAAGTFTTDGETGTITCEGPINGFDVTGAGTRGETGRYALDGPATCTDPAGTGDLAFSFTIPTAGGPQHVTGTAVMEYAPGREGGLIGGTFTGSRMYGKFKVTPIEGDCINSPVTKVQLECDEWVLPVD